MVRRIVLLAGLILLASMPTLATPTATAAPTHVITRSLSLGARGADVVEAQRRLNIWISANRPGIPFVPVTGYFGPITERAVRTFQQFSGLPVVGIIGPRTRIALPNDVSPCTGGFCTTRATVYLVALDDNGRSGKPVGCGDSLVPVRAEVPPTAGPLAAALTVLLATRVEFLGESGLYNSLHRSRLQLENVVIRDGVATVRITGELSLGGTCDDPRLIGQIEETALELPSVQSVTVLLNGQNLRDRLSQR